MRWLGLVTFASACGFAPASVSSQDAASDGAVDAPPDANPNCFGSHAIDRVCLAALPSSSMIFTGHDLDTDGPACFATTANGVPVCVIAYQSITVTTSSLIVRGSKPLVLVATTAITLDPGLIDLGSHFASPGMTPGAQSGAACTSGATAATMHGGGYGGTFTQGGAGGIDNNGVGAGLPAPPLPPPTKLAGGCAGGIGGGNASAASLGGGAIALIAPTITINATLTVGGAGGAGTSGTNANVGGNGGGAGGLIIIDTTMVDGSGFIYALGGGGGEGSGGNTGFDGHDGYDTTSFALSTIGGGNNSPSGGDGGNGGTMVAAMSGGSAAQGGAQAGGGGGGGAAGETILYGATGPGNSLTFSPSHQ